MIFCKMFANSIKYLLILSFLPLLIIAECTAEPAVFYPNWKLLKQREKAQFVAGYLKAWSDAQETLKIVQQFLEENPESAVPSVKKIIKIYDFNSLRPDTVAREIDIFYEDSKNQSQPLSVAITKAKAKLR